MALYLIECQNVMEDLQYMDELNHPKSIKMLVLKLPYKLRDKWRTVTDHIQEVQDRRVVFGDLVGFVDKHARIASNPIYGSLNDESEEIGEGSQAADSQTYRRRSEMDIRNSLPHKRISFSRREQ